MRRRRRKSEVAESGGEGVVSEDELFSEESEEK